MYNLQELDVWKAARATAAAAYRLTLSGTLSRHFRLAEQIRAAATSIPANLAEGYGLGSKAQLIRCARIALGSAYELQVHLELADELGLADSATCRSTQADCRRTIQLLIGLLRGLRARVPS